MLRYQCIDDNVSIVSDSGSRGRRLEAMMDAQNGATRGGVAIVTGGSRGLGKNMVQSIAGRGTEVIFTYQSNRAAADELVAELEGWGRRAAALQLDVGDAATFDAFVEQVRGVLRDWGTDRIQFLVNNAGIGVHASITDTTEAQFDQLMNVDRKSTRLNSSHANISYAVFCLK